MKNKKLVLEKLVSFGFKSNSMDNYPFVMGNNKMKIKWNSKISGIYVWINKLNGKMYIGKGNNVYRRVYEEKNQFENNKHGNLLKLYNAVKKYGIENFEVRLLIEIDKIKLFDAESLFIQFYDTKKCGYNITSGGNGCVNRKVLENQIKKQKDKMRFYWTDEEKRKHSDKLKIWFNNKTDEEKRNIIDNGKSWTFCENLIKKQRDGCLRSCTPDKIEKQKQSLLTYYKNNENKNKIKCEVVDSSGNVFRINGLYKFCVDNHLRFSGFKKMICGEVSEYKGWKLKN